VGDAAYRYERILYPLTARLLALGYADPDQLARARGRHACPGRLAAAQTPLSLVRSGVWTVPRPVCLAPPRSHRASRVRPGRAGDLPVRLWRSTQGALGRSLLCARHPGT
jgi:hypothetical protein